MTVEELVVKIGADIKDFETKLNTVSQKVKTAGQDFSKMTTPLLAVGTAMASGLGFAVKAAAENEKSTARLTSALKATGQYTSELQSKMLNLSSSMQDLTGMSDEAFTEMQAFGLQLGLTAEQTMALVPKIADLSASTGVDMETAMRAAAQAVNGNTGMLQRYGIHIEKAEDGTVSFNNILDAFSGYAGAAEAKGQTLAGQISWVKETFGDLAETVGGILMPIIKDLIEEHVKPLLEKLKAIPADELKSKVEAIIPVIITLVSVGVLGKLVGLLTSLTGPQGILMLIASAIILIATNWDKVKEGFANFYEKYIKPWYEPLKAALEWVLNTIKSIFGWFGTVMDKITIKVQGPGEAEGSYGGLQHGGIVTKPTLTWVGEKGPEAVIPLNKLNNEESLRIQKEMLKELRKFNEITAPELGKKISLSVSGLGGKV